MESITPGAINSVKVGSMEPYTGSSKAIGNDANFLGTSQEVKRSWANFS